MQKILINLCHTTLACWLVCVVQAQAPQKQLKVQVNHSASITAVAMSPDGIKILSGAENHIIHLREARSGHMIANISAHNGRINALAFAPDGKYFASASDDHLCILWNADNGTEIRRLKGHRNEVKTVAFAPNGQTLLTGSADGTAILWEVNTGKKLHTITGKYRVNSVAFSPDGKRFLVGFANGEAAYWDYTNKKRIKTISTKERLFYLAFSPDGKQFMAAERGQGMFNQGYLNLWDIESGKAVQSFSQRYSVYSKQTYYLYSAAFSPDGTQVLTCTANERGQPMNDFVVWDVKTGKKRMIYQEEAKQGIGFEALGFSANGKFIIAGSGDAVVRIIWAANGATLQAFRGAYTDKNSISKGVNAVDVSADGSKILAASWDNKIRYWQPSRKGTAIKVLKGHVFDVFAARFSPDGNQILSGGFDNQIRLWGLENNQLIKAGKEHLKDVNAVAFSPDGKKMLSGSNDRRVKLWIVDDSLGISKDTYYQASDYVVSVSFSPDGKHFLYAAANGEIYIHNAENGQIVNTIKDRSNGLQVPLYSAVYSPNGKQVASSSSRSLKIWDAATGKLKHAIELKSSAKELTYAKTGNWCAAITYPNIIQLWENGKDSLAFHRKLYVKDSDISSLVFSADGSKLLASCTDNTIRIWQTNSGQLLGTLYASLDGEVTWLVVTPDGKYDGNQPGLEYLNYVQPDGKTGPVPRKDPNRIRGLLQKLLSHS